MRTVTDGIVGIAVAVAENPLMQVKRAFVMDACGYGGAGRRSLVSTTPSAPGGKGRLAQVIATRVGEAPPEAPFVIEHREALIYMICEEASSNTGSCASTCSPLLALAELLR